MYSASETDLLLEIRFRAFIMPLVVMSLPPLMLFEYAGSLLDGSIGRGDFVGLVIAIVLPIVYAYFGVEFGCFRFDRERGVLRWSWRRLTRGDRGEVPLHRIVKVARDGLESSQMLGWRNMYRLVVILDDGTMIPLTPGYSSLHERRLDQLVEQARDYLGLFVRQA